jgi:hypothetical protein
MYNLEDKLKLLTNCSTTKETTDEIEREVTELITRNLKNPNAS